MFVVAGGLELRRLNRRQHAWLDDSQFSRQRGFMSS